MKFTVEHADFAAAVNYAARSLPARPPVPVLAGLLLHADTDTLRVSGFDYEISADTTIPATVTENGRALVSGRLLTDIASRVHGDVHLELTGSRLLLSAGSARFTLPTLPLDEYPALPEPGTPSGTLPGPTFAEAVTQVGCAISKDDSLPVLTGISLRHDQEAGTLTFVATDRYRFAVRTIPWKNCALAADCTALAPGKALLAAAKAVADDTTVDLSLPGDLGTSGLFTLRSEHSTTTLRALEGDLPKYQNLFPTEFNHTATVEIAALKAAAQRVALVTTRESPIRLTFTADNTLVLEAGTSDEAQALDNVDTNLEGDELTIAFNPGFLIDGLSALTTEAVEFQITTSTKPAILRGHGSDDQALRYLLMPIRLSS
ncbi:DNA polymerase III subunit beta [Streptomyces colonosanans]|uniref:Beta sliding clamp n=1 Tax=Streptomyces colonosanans TaxID=1428652 RepID=A0A1S2PNX9_9ACTN|nr:DNA polymerase III subunit beta [Streptomyces colonosanans]OIJ95433.1 DNA polymerase III subunit beta [Streptomyces colonosanans]